ncbi:MAG: hypothetical protein RIR70_667 [Pseudomonadota bacterium]
MANEQNPMSAPEQTEDEVSLLDLALVMATYKKRIMVTTFSAALLSVAVSLVLPNVYTGTTKVLPPQQGQSGAAALLSNLGGLAGAAGGLAGLKNPNDLYVGMLKSRTVADAMIARFDLQKHYETKALVDTRKKLESLTTIAAGKDGLISVEYEDEDPKFAADVANAYIEELYKLTQTLAVTEASQRRLFFEQQLNHAKEKLAAAEVSLKELQEKTGLLMLSEQSKASIESVARLRGQIAAKEVQIQAMRAFATSQNPDLKFAESELGSLRAQQVKLSQSEPGDILVPPSKIPGEGLEYVRRVREVKYSEVVFEVLAKQYELARIEEGKNASLIQVLDKAVTSDKKSKPKRGLIVMLATVAGFFLAVLSAFVSEAVVRARRDADTAQRLDELKRLVRG